MLDKGCPVFGFTYFFNFPSLFQTHTETGRLSTACNSSTCYRNIELYHRNEQTIDGLEQHSAQQQQEAQQRQEAKQQAREAKVNRAKELIINAMSADIGRLSVQRSASISGRKPDAGFYAVRLR